MKKVLAEVMNIEEEDISIKATTTEHLGFVGREEGIAAYATVLIFRNVS
jgi:2-C-methyl-D-erythritol 2,4-cyclodiphosphate synthase